MVVADLKLYRNLSLSSVDTYNLKSLQEVFTDGAGIR